MDATHLREMQDLAQRAWGNPTRKTPHEWRFGSHEGQSLNLDKLEWYDHETSAGGGYAQLYNLVHGTWPSNGGVHDRIMAVYEYQDEHGAPLFEVVRYPGHKFIQRRKSGSEYVYKLDGVRRVPYRLRELLAADIDTPVFIVEGEKDVDNLRAHALIATTNPGGAGKWRGEYNEHFRGRHLVIIPDNDEVGHKHAADVLGHLRRVAASARVLNLPELALKGDVSDWLHAGGTATELLQRAKETAEPDPGPPTVGRIMTGDAFIGAFVAPEWLVDGIVQQGRLYACTSLTGHGKTAVWLFISCMIQCGRMVGQLDVIKGNALILAGENPQDLQTRMIGMCRHYRIASLDLPHVLPHAFPMTDEECDLLKKEIEALGIELALIVGDTAASFFPGEDENDNVQAGAYARRLRSLTEVKGNPAVVALSHPVKNAPRDNLLPRGGSAFLNELDGNLTLYSPDKVVTALHWLGKIRGPDFERLSFNLLPIVTGYQDRRGRDVMTVVAEIMDEETVVNHSKQLLADEDAVLRRLHESPGITISQLCATIGWNGAGGEPDRKKAYRAMEGLRADKLIVQKRSRGPWQITQSGKEAIGAE